MKDCCIILLRLEGALQSWGEHSKFDYRDSVEMPSKSGIVGMIGCAMGLKRGSAKLEEISKNIQIAVRCDRKGKMYVDYHTVTAEKAILNAQGKPRCKTIVTYRTYLQDASYLAAIQTNQELASEIDDAFKNPCWTVYLGRKSCVPSVPVYIGIAAQYHTLEEAMNQYPPARRVSESDKIFYEIESTDSSGYERMDELQNAGQRYYTSRKVMLVRKEKNSVFK